MNFRYDGFRNFNIASESKVKSEKFRVDDDLVAAPSKASELKYEKVADITTKTNEFEDQEKRVRAQIKSQLGVIQYENKTGKDGKRKLQMMIGVPPENFDSLYVQLINIGEIASKSITKTDKTNEYRELQAKIATLQNTKASLLEIKGKDGEIGEYIRLEERILEIEGELQRLGVSLGDFDSENEFCTIRFGMSEAQIKPPIAWLQRIKVALKWTVEIWIQITVAMLLTFGFASIVVHLVSFVARAIKKNSNQ